MSIKHNGTHRSTRALAVLMVSAALIAGMGCSKSSKPTNSNSSDPQTFQVSASGTSFSPASRTIHVGDTVRWTSSGSHTVTSGTGAADLSAGSLFDQTLNSGGSFTRVFETAGVYHYFCRPHEAMGMKGTINVIPRS
jgi:plastocyanin